jgi:RecA/RadA recombinase
MSSDVLFIPSGCTLLDADLGGGWGLGKFAVIFGPPSTGKTQVCIETATNFLREYPSGKVWYLDAESAFDESYAEKLGLPVDEIKFVDVQTIEDFFKYIKAELAALPEGIPGLFIVDSFDAMTCEDEIKTDISEGTYGGSKPKQMSKIFRQLPVLLKKHNTTLFGVCQVRDKLDNKNPYGKKYDMVGGQAIRFYASQIVELTYIGTLHQEVTIQTSKSEEPVEEPQEPETSKKDQFKKKVKAAKEKTDATSKATHSRPIGVEIKYMVRKNKVGDPFRTNSFRIMFGYGIDDLHSCTQFVADAGRLKNLSFSRDLKTVDGVINALEKIESLEEYQNAVEELRSETRAIHQLIEDKMSEKRKRRPKY